MQEEWTVYPRRRGTLADSRRDCPALLCALFLASPVWVCHSAERAVAVEAEHATDVSFPFQVVRSEDASGGLALQIPEGIGSEEALSPGKGLGRALFDVAAPRAGRYHAWVRTLWNGNCSNSLLLKVGDGEPYNVIDNVMQRWHWSRGGEWDLRKGSNRVMLAIREDGVWVDQVLFRHDDGPPEQAAVDCPAPSRTADGVFPDPGVSLSVDYPESPPPRPADFKLRHDVEGVLPPPHMPTFVVGPQRTATLTVWLRRGSSGNAAGTVTVLTREALVVSPKREQPFRFEDEQVLTGVTFRLRAGVNMRRGEATLHVRVKHDSGRTVARRCRLVRPFEWLVSSPFRLSTRAGLETDTPLEERLNAGFPGTCPRTEWRLADDAAVTPFGLLDMRRAAADRRHCLAYAYTRVRAPADGMYLLHVQHDDMIRLWINGKNVLTSLECAPSSLTRRMAKVQLRAGSNHVLVKICQKKNYWEFGVRFLQADKRPAPVAGETVAHLLEPEGTAP